MRDFNQRSYTLAKGLAGFTQLGLCTALPVIFFIWGASWLQTKFSLGNWVLLAGIFLGIISGLYTFYKEAKMLGADNKKSTGEKDEGI